MKIASKIRLASILIGWIVIPAVSAHTVSLEMPKAGFMLGEPVYASVIVANTANDSVVVPAMLNPSTGGVRISITGPDGEAKGFVPVTFVDHDEPPHEVEGGKQIGASFGVFFGANGWTFDREGNYQVRAIVEISGKDVASEPVSIEVTRGSALSAKLVAANLASLEAGKFLYWLGGDHLSQGTKLLSAVASEESGTPLASHIELAFGWSKSRSFTNFATGRIRTPDNHAALEHLEKVQDADLPPSLRVMKGIAQASSFIRLGEIDHAKQALERSAKLVGTNPALISLLPQIERLHQSINEPPPLHTEVIVNDTAPPQDGCELLTQHTFSSCRDGFWHVVTRATYLCGQTQIVKEVYVLRTNQPCAIEDQVPNPLGFLGPLGPPDGCVSPIELFSFQVWACPNFLVEWHGYDMMQCADGTTYIRRDHSDDFITRTPCERP